MQFTVLEDGHVADVDARIESGPDGPRVVVGTTSLERALGWSLKPQGLCRGETCVPIPPQTSLVRGDGVDLAAFADLLGRPLACDADAGAAFLGESAENRGRVLRGGQAPDFTLPDLDGRLHSLGDQRGRKVLLVAWASW